MRVKRTVMINDKIDTLIKESMLNKDDSRTSVLRLIKARFLEFKTAKNAKPLDEIAEISILNKMIKDRNESAALYLENNRLDLAQKELEEAKIIGEFVPPTVTEEELKGCINLIITNEIEPIKKNMGLIIRKVKEKYPQSDGKIVSKLVQNVFNS